MLPVLRIALCLSLLTFGSSSKPFCNPDAYFNNPERPKMANFAKEVTAHIVCKETLNNDVIHIDLFYTPSQIRIDVRKSQKDGDDKYSARIYPETGERLTISGDTCSTTTKSFNDKGFLKYIITKNTLSLAQIFRFDNPKKIEYHGRSLMDFWPRPVDTYSRCIRVAGFNRNVIFYFEAGTKFLRPVRAVISSEKSNITVDVTTYTNHITKDEETFAIPRNVVCERYKVQFDVTGWGKHFYYEEEIIQPYTKTIAYNKIDKFLDFDGYEHQVHISRIDYRSHREDYSQIYNYKHLNDYLINRYTGRCEKKRMDLERVMRDSIKFGTRDGLLIRFDSLHLISLNTASFYRQGDDKVTWNIKLDDFFYQGQERVDGVRCKVYRARRIITHGNTTIRPTITFYFVDGGWRYMDSISHPMTIERDGHINGIGQEMARGAGSLALTPHKGIGNGRQKRAHVVRHAVLNPHKLIVRNGQQETWYKYHKFTRGVNDFSAFDTSACLDRGDFMSLVLTILGPDKPFYMDQLREQARAKLAQDGALDLYRIQNIRVWRDPTAFYLGATILGTDDYIESFDRKGRSRFPVPIHSKLHNILSVEACAAKCVNNDYIFCKSIYYCAATSVCYLSKELPRKKGGKGRKHDVPGRRSCTFLTRRPVADYEPTDATETLTYSFISIDEIHREYDIFFTVRSSVHKPVQILSTSEVQVEYAGFDLGSVPTRPKMLAYRIELRAPPDTAIPVTKYVYYDETRRFLQVKIRSPSKANEYRVKTVVTDLKSDKKYTLFEDTGDCNISAADNITMLDNPLYFLNDGITKYKPVGKTSVRGVLCTIFTSTSLVNVSGVPLTVHYLVATKIFVLRKRAYNKTEYIPMQIRAYNVKAEKSFIANIFDVDKFIEEPRPSIATCFHSDTKIRLFVTFKVPFKENFILKNKRKLIQDFRDYLLRNMSLPHLAAADDVITTDSKNLYYSITLLDLQQRSGGSGVDDIYTELVNNVYRGYVTVDIHYSVGSGPTATVSTSAVSITKVEDQLKPTDSQPATHMQRFFESKPDLSETSSPGWGGKTAVDGCATQCIEVSWLDCLSFMYCFDDNHCTIFNERRAVKQQYRSECRFYIKKFIADYAFLGGTNKKLDGDTVSAKNVDDCAKSCTDKVQNCRGFSFCAETRTCVLSGSHEVPVTTTNMSAECLSYSRNYLADFAKFPGQSRSKGASSVINGLSLSQCANKCALTRDQGCVEFDFCNATDGTECYLYANDAAFTSIPVTRTTCDRYVGHVASTSTAQTMVTTTMAPSTTLLQAANTTSPRLLPDALEHKATCYTRGAVVGIAVGTFAGGVIFTTLMFLIIRCFSPRCRKTDDLDVELIPSGAYSD